MARDSLAKRRHSTARVENVGTSKGSLVPHIYGQRNIRAAGIMVIVSLVSLLLAACGGSSSSGSSTGSTAAVASATTATTQPATTSSTIQPSSSTAAKKPPSSTSAKTSPATSGGTKAPTSKAPSVPALTKKNPAVDPQKLAKLNAAVTALRTCMRGKGMTIPRSSGTSQAGFEAALKQCIPGLKLNLPTNNTTSEAKSVTAFVGCMRGAGVNLPEPKSSASGPVLNTEGVDTSSAQFKAALAKCKGDLPGVSGLVAGSIGGTAGSAVPSG